MKEMCRNFVCSNNHNTQVSSSFSNTTSAQPAESSSTIANASMNGCSNCVMNRIGLAQAYVPSQPYTTPTEEEQSLICGTGFSDLAMPYCSGWNLYRFRRED